MPAIYPRYDEPPEQAGPSELNLAWWAMVGIAIGLALFSALFLYRKYTRNRRPAYAPRPTVTVVPLSERYRRTSEDTDHPAPGEGTADAATAQKKHCAVCLEDLPRNEFAKKAPTQECKHGPGVCKHCLQLHVDFRLRGLETGAVPCPTPFCSAFLSYYDMKAVASEDAFTRYDNQLMRKAVGNQPAFVWCKNPKCEAGQFHVCPKSPRSFFQRLLGQTPADVCPDRNQVICYACGAKSCFKHDVQWHEGFTCDEYELSDATKATAQIEAKSLRTIERKTRACPQCRTPVEKIGGCAHVYCRPPGGCGHHFLWMDSVASKRANRV